MKHILLPKKSDNMHHFRANLHCHSTGSDGEKTPEELKNFYRENGYSILCITDHEVYFPHNDLSDSDFLMLNGTELSMGTIGKDYRFGHTCHICMVAKDAENKTMIEHTKENFTFSNMPQDPSAQTVCSRHYSIDSVNKLIKCAKDAGFYVTYNHPAWSRERYPVYMSYEGMDAFELINYGGVVFGTDGNSEIVYDDLLCGGKKIHCTATDDNHNHIEDYGPYCDSFGGYIVIAAEKLDYSSVIDSLQSGRFYSCLGTCTEKAPEITYLDYENGKIHVESSPVKHINIVCHYRSSYVVNAPRGEFVTGADFEVQPDEKWFRITVTDEYGRKSFTNAYFPEDLNR